MNSIYPADGQVGEQLPLEQSLNLHDAALQDLAISIDGIAARLEYVLLPTGIPMLSEPQPGAPMPVKSPAVEKVDKLTAQVSAMIRRINSLRTRI